MVSQKDKHNDGEKEISYEYIRTAKRDHIAIGFLVYAKCEECGCMVPLLQGHSCDCGNVFIEVFPDGKCRCAGGKGMVELYREVMRQPAPVDEVMANAEAKWCKGEGRRLLSEEAPGPVKSLKPSAVDFAWK